MTESIAHIFKSYANQFIHDDWQYSRHHEIKHIRLANDFRGFDRPTKRIQRALKTLFWHEKGDLGLLGPHGVLQRINWALWSLRTEQNLPDGVLDHGNIITFWEETGEYLQFVQPSVGEMIADWLIAEPENEHAMKIMAEMTRIQDDYGRRLDKK